MNQTGVSTCAKSGGNFSWHERSCGYLGAKDRNVALRLSDRTSSTNFGGSPQNAGRTKLESDILFCSLFNGLSKRNDKWNIRNTSQNIHARWAFFLFFSFKSVSYYSYQACIFSLHATTRRFLLYLSFWMKDVCKR